MSVARVITCVRAALAVIALIALAQPAAAESAGLQRDVVFTDTTALSSNAELVRRMLSPLLAAQIPRNLARTGGKLREQPVDPSQEKFVVYVPAQKPPEGYALLVFVPPWDDARLPEGWAPVLDQFGAIFVSAARSGNKESVLGRREPLALIAEQNIVRHYAVDPRRVYVGGFSGGSRVALSLALGYPDVFHGALLNAGSDPIGNAMNPLPPRDLFFLFQSATRLVQVTGEQDAGNLEKASASAASMRAWCVFDVETETTRGVAHAVAGPEALSKVLRALDEHISPDPERLAACRSEIETKLNAALQQVESLLADGKREDAQKLLNDIDTRFGGLAAPRSVETADRISPPPS